MNDTSHVPGDDPLVPLSRVVERTSRRVGELDERVRALTGAVADLARAGGSPAEGEAGAVSHPPSWLLVGDREAAGALLGDLVEWLGAVYLRYPDAHLPSCWLWHPAAVEELWVLRGAHRDAFGGPQPAWAKASDWHDRQRPGVVKRLSPLGACALSEHRPDGAQDKKPEAAPLAGHIDAIADAWTTTGMPPVPSEEQRAHAQTHDDDLLKTNHH